MTALADEASAVVAVEAPGMAAMLSASTWEATGLPPHVVGGALAKGWSKPSKIQAQALPYILSPSAPSVLAQAKNGAGKTGAFGLAMLARVDPRVPAIQAICLSPTRELAQQTTKVLLTLASAFPDPVLIAAVTGGGVGGGGDRRPIEAHVVVATASKAANLIKDRRMDVSAGEGGVGEGEA